MAGDEIDLGTDDEKQAEPEDGTLTPPALNTSAVLPVQSSSPAFVDVKPVQSLSQGHTMSASPLAAAGVGDEASDQLIEITVSEPKKVGDGYGSYVVYRVNTKTNLPFFRRNSFSVCRRFSDFRGLRDKLAEKHLHTGRIVPPAPEKDAVGTAKVKMSKDDDVGHDDFIGKRRMALERFLNRTAAHPVLRADPDFREFLELDTDLPKSTSSSALSGAGVKRLLSRFGDTVNKMTFKMDENDSVSILILLTDCISAYHCFTCRHSFRLIS